MWLASWFETHGPNLDIIWATAAPWLNLAKVLVCWPMGSKWASQAGGAGIVMVPSETGSVGRAESRAPAEFEEAVAAVLRVEKVRQWRDWRMVKSVKG